MEGQLLAGEPRGFPSGSSVGEGAVRQLAGTRAAQSKGRLPFQTGLEVGNEFGWKSLTDCTSAVKGFVEVIHAIEMRTAVLG